MALDGFIGQTKVAPVKEPLVCLHCAILLADGSWVDDDMFRLVNLQGQESISNPFEFQLTLHGNTDPIAGQVLSFTDIIGRPVTFAINRPYREEHPYKAQQESCKAFKKALQGESAEELSCFNGIATGFAMHEPGVYNLTVKPALWKLTLTNRYCIHENKSIRSAIFDLLRQHKIAVQGLENASCENPATAREQDWLQAGETDYEFIQRLMAKSHLYYYFKHTATGHTVVFANRPNYPLIFAEDRPLRYTYTQTDPLGLEQDDVIRQYSYQRTLQSSGVNGVFVRQQHAWEELPFHIYKIYQYGCSGHEVAKYTNATASTIGAAETQLTGSSYCPAFRSCYQFQVDKQVGYDCNPNPVRPSLEGKWYVLTQVQHHATLDGGYQNQFQATEADVLITPFSTRDTHQGTVLAKVVAHGM